MTISEFKDNLFDAASKHARQLFVPSLLLTILSGFIMLAVLIPVATSVLPKEFFDMFTSNPSSFEDIMKNQEKMQRFIMSHLSAFLTVYAVLFVVLMVVGSYTLNAGFLISKDKLEGEAGWGRRLLTSFGNKWAKTILALLIVFIVYLGSFALATTAARLGVIVFFIALIVALAFVMRFVLVFPAISIADFSLSEAFRFSLRNLSWGRGFKLVFALFVSGIVFFIVLLIISLTLNLFGNNMVVNGLQNLVLLGMNGIFYAFALAGVAGLFYRYGNFEETTEAEVIAPENPAEPEQSA